MIRVAAAAGILALLSGGAPQAAGTGTAMARDACALITADEVSAVLGAKVGPADRKDSGDTPDVGYSSTCIWKLADGRKLSDSTDAPFGGAGFAMLNTITWTGGPAAAGKYLEDFRDAARNNLIDNEPVPVKAGDEALWWGDGVAVRKGSVSFGVSVHTGTDKAAERRMEEALAKTIAGRL